LFADDGEGGLFGLLCVGEDSGGEGGVPFRSFIGTELDGGGSSRSAPDPQAPVRSEGSRHSTEGAHGPRRHRGGQLRPC